MNEGLRCLLLSCTVGAFSGFFGAAAGVVPPTGSARRKAGNLRHRLIFPWIRSVFRRAETASHTKTGVLRFLRDLLYPLFCAVVLLLFVSYASDGELRIYMLVPFVTFQWITLRFLSGAAYLFRCAFFALAADIVLTPLLPAIRISQRLIMHIRNLHRKIWLSLCEKYDMMKKKRKLQREARGFSDFRKEIAKELKTWPRSSDAFISLKSQKP